MKENLTLSQSPYRVTQRSLHILTHSGVLLQAVDGNSYLNRG